MTLGPSSGRSCRKYPGLWEEGEETPPSPPAGTQRRGGSHRMGARLRPRRAHQCPQPLRRTPPLQALKCSLKPLGVSWASFSHTNHFSANTDFPMNSLKMTESDQGEPWAPKAFNASTTQGNGNVFHELVFRLTKSRITMPYTAYLRNTWSEIRTRELALRID